MFTTYPLLAVSAARLDRALAAATACLVILASSAGAQGETRSQDGSLAQERAKVRLTLPLGQAEVVRYSREPGTVIIGDPAVAAASIAASDILVLTGIQAGETNLIVLDDGGAQIDRMTLRVVERGDTVVLRRGLERQVLRCNPLCSPTDAPGFAPGESSLPQAADALDFDGVVDTEAPPKG